MAILEIRYLDGTTERRELTKQAPLSIGSHSSSDIRIVDKDVQPLHCRIAWKKDGYEVTSGSTHGVEVNGKSVSFSSLKEGDVLQIGQVDVCLAQAESGEEDSSAKELVPILGGLSAEIDLKPLTDDLIPQFTSRPIAPPPAPVKPESKPEKKPEIKAVKDVRAEKTGTSPKHTLSSKNASPTKTAGSQKETNPLKDAAPQKSKKDKKETKVERNESPPSKKNSLFDDDGDDAPIGILDAPATPAPEPTLMEIDLEVVEEATDDATSGIFLSRSHASSGEIVAGEKSAPSKERDKPAKSAPASASPPPSSNDQAIVSRLKKEFASARPGEQELLRSPLVLGLGGGTLILLLLGATFYFIILRDSGQRFYDEAYGRFEQRDYNQAIPLFENFIEAHGRHRMAPEARWNLSVAKVDQYLAGSVPDWQSALDALNELLKVHRRDEDFAGRKPAIVHYAEIIALEAAKSAGSRLERPLLQTSAEALALVDLNSEEDSKSDIQQQVAAAQNASESLLRRHEALTETLQKMMAALDDRDTLEALRNRQQLLDRYPRDEFISGNSDLRNALNRALDLEKSLVTQNDETVDALPPAPPANNIPKIALTPHARSRTNVQSENQVAFVLAQDAVFAVDTMTGIPQWSQTLGDDAPFFPQPMQTSISGLLAFHTVERELRYLSRQDGSIVWRQPLTGELVGSPLLFEGQIYIAATGGNLWRIDQESGRLNFHLKFPQELSGAPAVAAQGNALVVAGNEGVVYTLGLRPLLCSRVTYLGHKPSTIAAPLMTLGSMVLAAENNTADSSLLRMLSVTSPEQPLRIAGSQKVDGHVRDELAVRGNQLFVPSSGERITVFTVSDEAGQPALSRVAMFQVEEGKGGRIYVTAGPNGQLWMSSTAFRRLEVEGDAIKPDSRQLAVGLSSQPLQMIGDFVYVGRKQPFSTAVYFAQVAREEMTSPWRTILGSPVLRVSAVDGNSAVLVNETGDVFKIGLNDFTPGGFKLSPTTSLPISETLKETPRAVALPNGRMAVAIGGEKPRLWVLNAAGQVEADQTLEAPIDHDPFPWADGILVSAGGRIRLIQRSPGLPPVEEFAATSGADPALRWRSILPVDDEHLIAIDENGKMVKLQLRQSPTPVHLAEISSVQLDHPVDVSPAIIDGRLCIADASGELSIWDASTFDKLHAVKLKAPASRRLWTIGNKLCVQVGTETLNCFQLDDEPKSIWELPLNGNGLAGAPVQTERGVVVVHTNGTIELVGADNGQVEKKLSLASRLTSGALAIGEAMVTLGSDGSVHRIDEWIKSASAETAASE
ncbi:MAG: PQQ-binding-like beta-propeller repeat protein [Planctomycetaceae bacterium]